MKSFFEEYGFVILAAIVVIILIAMATPIGDLVKIQVSEVVNSFGSKTQSKLNATDGIIQVRVSTVNNKITLEWEAVKKEDKFKYQYKASNTSKDADWTPITEVSTGSDKSRKVEITSDSNNQPLANKTKVEYKIYDSNDQLVASGVVTAKVGKNATTGGEGGTGGGSTENPSAPTITLTAGQKIIIADKEYTVIENVEGNKYKVLANALDENKQFNTIYDNNYATSSSIAAYLDNDYLDTLPESIRNAIVETPIQQKVVSNKEKTNGSWVVTYNESQARDAGTHKVFVPSWEEVTKAYGSTPDKLKKYSNGWTWLRDAYGSGVLFVSSSGNLGDDVPDDNNCVRPAFVLDLSKVTYTSK